MPGNKKSRPGTAQTAGRKQFQTKSSPMRRHSAPRKFSTAQAMRVIIITGLILLVLVCASLVFFRFLGRESIREENFARLLREYDSLSKGDTESLARRLDQLEKRAVSAENWLSILKRRKSLARLSNAAVDQYRQSCIRAAEACPHSQPVAAVASSALLFDSAVDRETEERLRSLLPVLASPPFTAPRLAMHILLGDFANPLKAQELDFLTLGDIETLCRYGGEPVSPELAVDLAIIKILNGKNPEALLLIQNLLKSRVSDDFVSFAAEFFYDFGDPAMSALLFSRLPGDEALLRQADALWLAGFPDSARTIWSILAYFPAPLAAESLYNLAACALSRDEEASLLERLVSLPDEIFTGATDNIRQARQFGFIRYTRLLPAARAISMLNPIVKDSPIADLEILRRRIESGESRIPAEAWLLLDRHDMNEDLYLWAAWLFSYYRNYPEAAMLLRRCAEYGFADRVRFYEAVVQMAEGDLRSAADLLNSIPEEQWVVYANLGRISESEASPTHALAFYELAASLVGEPKAASRVQRRIAGCLTALGRRTEARRALQYALELDPDNINARLELDRS
jgi:tetratricopeptide (TPR) repeat protein